MPRSIHVRLDTATEAALDTLKAAGLTDSQAVRTALQESAAHRRHRSALREEAQRLAADEADRAEMALIRRQMDALAPTNED